MSYREKIRDLSRLLLEAQKPLRVLDAIKWPVDTEEQFLKNGARELPKISVDTYEKSPLGYDVEAKEKEFLELGQKIQTDLGNDDGLAKMLSEVCRQYHDCVQMVKSRGTKKFYEYSKLLYGAASDPFWGDKTTLRQAAYLLNPTLRVLCSVLPQEQPQEHVNDGTMLTSEASVEHLYKKLSHYFGDEPIRVKLSDGIVADAAAGGDVIKLRENAAFSKRELDILEVHEGWVHMGTSLNGSKQSVAKFLSKGPPRVASTQEGLAVLTELFSLRTNPKRAKEIVDRVIAIDKAEEGANFLEIFEFYRVEGYPESECFNLAKRIFRGGLLDGGAPFTKDLSYIKGFIENYNFIRAAMRAGKPEYVKFMFVGKIHLLDIPLLHQKYLEGIIDEPRFLPPFFRDLSGLAVWMSFSHVFNMIDMKTLQANFAKIF